MCACVKFQRDEGCATKWAKISRVKMRHCQAAAAAMALYFCKLNRN